MIDGEENSNFNISRFNNSDLDKVYEYSYTAEKDVTFSYVLNGNAGNEIFEFQLWAQLRELENYVKYGLGSIDEIVGSGNLFDLNAETIQESYNAYKGNLVIDGDSIFYQSTDKQYNRIISRNWVIELPTLDKDIYISAESIVKPYRLNAGLFYKFVDTVPNENEPIEGRKGTDISVSANGKQIKVTPTAKYLLIIVNAQYIKSSSATGHTEDRTVTVNKLIVSYSKSPNYVRHEEQNITMPVQQEMLNGDYFDWKNEKEVHGWGKVVVDGTNGNISIGSQAYNDTYARFSLDFLQSSIKTGGLDFYCDKLKLINQVANIEDLTEEGIVKRTISKDNWCQVVIRRDRLTETTAEAFKTWLADNNLTIYYPLATPTELDFTTEQKAVKEQIKSLHSYKNVTHIFSTDEVAPITDVTYFKDLETELAKRDSKDADLQQQINNITELLSTTETSALLLDNYETDLESEVEEI